MADKNTAPVAPVVPAAVPMDVKKMIAKSILAPFADKTEASAFIEKVKKAEPAQYERRKEELDAALALFDML